MILDSTAKGNQRELVEESIAEADEAFSCNNIHREQGLSWNITLDALGRRPVTSRAGLRDIQVPMQVSVGD